MQRNIQRSLVIGLGPTGRLVAERLRSLLETRHQGVPYVGFLIVDLSREAASANAGDEPILFVPHEQVFALPVAGLSDFINQAPVMESMISVPMAPDFDVTKFASTRLGANLMFQRQATRGIAQSVSLALDESLRRLFDPPAEWASRNDFVPDSNSKAVAVYVVASTAEPCGGGPLPDLMYLLGELPRVRESWVRPETHGVLMLFEPSTTSEQPLSDFGRACTYATLDEIDRLFAGEPFANAYLNINSTAQPFSHSCYLVDLDNEVGYSLQTADNAISMVAEWLAQVIVEPPREIGTDRISHLRGDKEIRAYSAFSLARQSLNIQGIEAYYANRFGADLLNEEGLLTLQVEQRISGVAAENFEKARGDSASEPDNSLDVVSLLQAHQDDHRCRISLNELRERIAKNLWPGTVSLTFGGSDFDSSFHRVPLNALERRIVGAAHQQQEHLSEYQRQVEDRCHREVIPQFKERLTRQTWSLVDDHPVGGLELAHRFLGQIRQRIKEEHELLKKMRDQVATRAAAAQQSLDLVQEEGRLALRNYPRIRPLMRRVGIMSLVVLMVIFFYYTSTHDVMSLLRLLVEALRQGMKTLRSWYYLPLVLWVSFLALICLALWRSQVQRPQSYQRLVGGEGRFSWLWTGIEIALWLMMLVLMTLGIFGLTRSGLLDPAYNLLMLVGVLAAAKILIWDYLFGLVRSGAPDSHTGKWEGGLAPNYNLPGWPALLVVEFLLIGLTLMCVSWSRDLPNALSVWIYLVLLAALAGGLLAFWVWYDERDIRRKAELWVMAHNHHADLVLQLRKMDVGQDFYEQAQVAVDLNDQEVVAFKTRLAEAGKEFAIKMGQQRQQYKTLSERRFTRPLMSWERVTQLYSLTIPSALGEIEQGGKEGLRTLFKQTPDATLANGRLSDWRGSDTRQIHDDLVTFIGQRFASTWAKVSITDLLAGPGDAFPERVYQQELRWIMMEASRPYWRYSGHEGDLALYVGLGNVEDRNLRRAVDGFTAATGAPPEIFSISSQHVIACLGSRHNLPLSLIRSVQECRAAYETVAAKTATLHVRPSTSQ